MSSSDPATKKPRMSETGGDVEPEVTVTFKWKLDESYITSKRRGEVIKSPVFPLSDTRHCRIELYPKGDDNPESKNYASMYLESVKGDFEARGRIYLLNYKGQIVNPVALNKHFYKANDGGWGVPKFRETDLLISTMIRTYLNGVRKRALTIACELTFEISVEKGPFFTLEFESRLKEFDDFAKLIDNCEFSDVILTTKDRKLHAHKNILANKSPVFAEMFTYNINKNGKKVVNIEDVTYDVMRELLRFIYTGRVNNLEATANELFVAAGKYSVEGLKKMCESYLIRNINCENVLEYLNLASLHNASILRDHSMLFFQSNVKKTMLQTNFKVSELNKNIVDEVCRIIATSMKD